LLGDGKLTTQRKVGAVEPEDETAGKIHDYKKKPQLGEEREIRVVEKEGISNKRKGRGPGRGEKCLFVTTYCLIIEAAGGGERSRS